MFTRIFVLAVTMVAAMACNAAVKPDSKDQRDEAPPWEALSLVGRPVDIAPWAYQWRADRVVQEKPEAYFIPRRLDRQDKVYRTLFESLPEQERRSLSYEVPEVLEPLPPKPEGNLLAGLMWTGRLEQYRVELRWPAEAKDRPLPESVEVRSFPTSFGWFGWCKDEILSGPEVSPDGRTWTYKRASDEVVRAHVNAAGRDWYRSGSSTEMIAVFCKAAKPVVPSLHVTAPRMGSWQRIDIEIEWGFEAGKNRRGDGRLESYVAMIGPMSPLSGDTGTRIDGNTWKSRAAGSARRGIVVPLLYTASGQPALDSRLTVWRGTSGFTFRINDLESGPIYIPEHGVFITRAGSGQTARAFVEELSARNLKGIRQMTREHPEFASWEALMREVRLSTCPAGTALAPYPPVDNPPMQVELSDQGWADAWRAASNQLKGKHMWGGLAFEVGRVAHDMDMVGLHGEADKIYEHFLQAPGAKSDGDYADGNGALEWATAMRHDIGYSHDGTHASTGRLLFAMAERYFLTGDKAWFEKKRARLQAAADWIIRQRTLYMQDIPNRKELLVSGLMPPYMLGDYALPSCEWRWYYVGNALDLQGLQRFADALLDFDPKTGRTYQKEAEAFRQDLRRAVDRETALSPVRIGCDGVYRSFIPQVAYVRGELLAMEYASLQRPQGDVIMGSLSLAEQHAALDASDPRMVGTLNAMEEIGASPKVRDYVLRPNIDGTMDVMAEIRASAKSGRVMDDDWFRKSCGESMPKASLNANIYLLQDDIPSFLHFWMTSYAALVGADGRMWEWSQLGTYASCAAPDNGTAGWFLECYRNMLVMEEGDSLWIARATPRAWLEQGKTIAVKNAPTEFGALAYELVSAADSGKITATVAMPSRKPMKSVILRLRHPKAATMRRVTVNGQPWKGFDPARETITLAGLTGKAIVVAEY